jgi:hypothetical protein
LKILTGLALAAAATTAHAAAEDKPPLQFPPNVEGMALRSEFDQPFNIGASYTRPGETISVYLYRATHPNAALWFERAEAILQETWKSRGLGPGGEMRQVRVAGAASPNGLMRVFAVSGSLKSTGVAVAQLGRWLVKVRSSSATLNPTEQTQRMERILAAFGATGASGTINPLQLPEPCSPEQSSKSEFDALLAGEMIPTPSSETILAAGPVVAAAAWNMAEGKTGLAADPGKYCRAPLESAGVAGALYRPKEAGAKDWIVLLADSGTSISGLKTLLMNGKKTSEGGLVTANGHDKARAVLFAKDVPSPEIAFPVAGRLLMSGNKEAYVAVAYGTGNIEVSLPK